MSHLLVLQSPGIPATAGIPAIDGIPSFVGVPAFVGFLSVAGVPAIAKISAVAGDTDDAVALILLYYFNKSHSFRLSV
jgi:hypothetical protein